MKRVKYVKYKLMRRYLTKTLRAFFFFTLILFFYRVSNSFANYLNITNTKFISLSTTTKTVLIQFDISWNNSWKDSINNDAAWVFVKWMCLNAGCSNSAIWRHCTLKTSGTNPSGFSTGSGTAIDIIVPSDKKGCFIQRKSQGSGSVSTTSVQLVWDYNEDGASADSAYIPQGSANFLFNIYGVEMVYIPQGGFYVGDGNNGTVSFEFEFGSSSSLPPTINSETGISFTSAAGSAWFYNSTAASPEFASGALFNIPASFPKGYNAFYLMKYELSQGQYVAFLNALTRDQQNQRVASTISASTIPNYYVMAGGAVGSNRNTITCASTQANTSSAITFSATSSIGAGRDNRAAGFFAWMDLAAYADWAALRPMTEFEYEKASRGPIYPVVSENAWGTSTFTDAATLSGTEDGTETITDASANRNGGNAPFTGGDAGSGPLRAGIFATSSTATRVKSGAGYYGNMELTGNLEEMTVTVGNSAGLSFTGTHGDGVLTDISGTTNDGNATNLDWPGIDATSIDRGITAATGAGNRGGDTKFNYAVSDRTRAADNTVNVRSNYYGIRLARTAP